jgi:hypothetical protein
MHVQPVFDMLQTGQLTPRQRRVRRGVRSGSMADILPLPLEPRATHS